MSTHPTAPPAAPIISTDEDGEVGYMLVNEQTPATMDARLATFVLRAARDWGEVFDPRKLTAGEDPIDVVDDPDTETWRAAADGESPTHRWYVFQGLHGARVHDDAPRGRALDPTFPVHVAQVIALAAWVYTGEHPATVQLTSRPDGSLYAVQGDDHLTVPRPIDA